MTHPLTDAVAEQNERYARLRRLGYLGNHDGIPWKVPADLVPLYRKDWPDLASEVPVAPWLAEESEERIRAATNQILPRLFDGRPHFVDGWIRIPVSGGPAAVADHELAFLPGDALMLAETLLRLGRIAAGGSHPVTFS